MAKFLGQLLFELLWDLAWREVHAFIWRMIQKADAWLASKKLGRRTTLVVGLLLGLAAWGIWPLLAWLLANRIRARGRLRAFGRPLCVRPMQSEDQATNSRSTIACSRL